jgi:hypothetical protein
MASTDSFLAKSIADWRQGKKGVAPVYQLQQELSNELGAEESFRTYWDGIWVDYSLIDCNLFCQTPVSDNAV